MATQGIVSVCKDGKVVMKFIAGDNGMTAVTLAAAIRAAGEVPASVRDGYELAVSHKFGSERSLVVMTETEAEFAFKCDLPPEYLATFHQPEFNPRWKQGTAEYVEVVHL